MAVSIKIPTWVTFNKIPEGTPAVGLATLNAMLGVNLSVGDPNPVWNDLQDLDLGGGPLTRGASLEALAQVTEIHNSAFLPISYAGLIVGIGGEIDGWEVVFEIDDPTAEVPASFPDRTYTEYADPEDPESGTEVVHTWETWGLDGGRTDLAPEQVNGKWYRLSQVGSTGGRPMPASAWVPAALAGLVVMKTKPAPVE